MIDPEALAEFLKESPTEWEIEYVESIDSTNRELTRRFSNTFEAPNLVLWADEQTAGCGRLERKWLSIPGEDITVSLIFPAPVPAVDIPKLSLCAGLALVEVFRDEYGIVTMLRWPNDVMCGMGKIAGILSSYLTEPDAVICGIGINVNSRPDSVLIEPYRRRTTVLEEIGERIEREELLGKWICSFEKLWPLAEGDRLDDLREKFEKVNFYGGRRVKVLPGAGMDREDDIEAIEMEGIAGSLDGSGALVVNISEGTVYSVSVNDVLIPLD